MKKFQFRLDRVLRYRQQQLKQAELQMARAVRELDAAKTIVVSWQQQIDVACQSKETAGTLIIPATRANLTAHLEQLGNSLAIARERLQGAEQRFRETERVRAEISQAVEGLSQLRQLQQREHRDEINRQLQIDIDEIVMRKWSARNGDDTLLLAD
jgi:flagellar export protein FliJ